MTTGASCPWNLSTVPMRAPGRRSCSLEHLGVVRRDDQDVLERDGPFLTVTIDPGASCVQDLVDQIADPVGLFGRRILIALVRDGQVHETGARAAGSCDFTD